MLIKIDADSGVSVYLQIIRQVRRLIALGALKPGDRLPAVRELAVQLRINPNTVARAYRDLQHEEIVDGRWGEGTFISEKAAALAEKEREEIVGELLDDLLSQGRTLGYTDEEIGRLLEKASRRRGVPRG